MNNKKLGKILKNKRKNLKLTQTKLADIIKIHRNFYSDIERGTRNPSLETLTKVLNGLDLKIEIVEK